jgi:hypothetical protein
MPPENQSLVCDSFAKVGPIAAIWHRQGQGNQRMFRLIIGAAMLSAAAAAPAAAEDVTTDVNFAGVNLSPWNSGPAFDLNHVYDLGHSFNVNLPDLNGNPVQAIADLLGANLPVQADVTVGGNVNGNFNVNLGYEVSGGRVNIDYPALATLSVPTIPGTTNEVIPGAPLTLGTNFQPGLNKAFAPVTDAALALAAGGGYSLPGLGINLKTIQAPTFTTQFPAAAAWADLSYNVNAGASVAANLVLPQPIGCVVCVQKNFTFGDAQNFELLNITPQSLVLAGQNLGNPSSTTIQIPGGVGSITVNIPNLAVSGGLSANSTSLTGSGSQPVIQIDASLDQLVPLVGAALHNSIPPISYTLLGASGGPQLSLYQNFSFTPTPTVDLLFSKPVLQNVNGTWQPTTSVAFNASAPPTIEVPWTSTGAVNVQPVYQLDGTLHNETGISVGASVNLSGLELDTPLGNLGPAFSTTLTSDLLVQIPLFNQTFDENLGQIAADPFTLDATAFRGSQFTGSTVTWNVTNVAVMDEGGEGDFADITESSSLFPGSPFSETVSGSVINFGTPDAPESIFISTEDAHAPDGTDLGDAFCIVCDASSLDPVNPSVLGTDGDTLFTSDLTTYPAYDPCTTCDPHLAGTSFFDDPTPVPTVIGPTVSTDVPEPYLAELPGLITLLAVRRRRTRRWRHLGAQIDCWSGLPRCAQGHATAMACK